MVDLELQCGTTARSPIDKFAAALFDSTQLNPQRKLWNCAARSFSNLRWRFGVLCFDRFKELQRASGSVELGPDTSRSVFLFSNLYKAVRAWRSIVAASKTINIDTGSTISQFLVAEYSMNIHQDHQDLLYTYTWLGSKLTNRVCAVPRGSSFMCKLCLR